MSNTVKFSLISLISGIISLILFYYIVGGIIGILAITMGILALVKEDKKAMPVIGLVCGIIGLICSALVAFTNLSDNIKAGRGISFSDSNGSVPVDEPAEKVIKGVWYSDYTPIEDFTYYIEGDNLHIKRYNGKNKKVNIAPAYQIDGATYHTISFEDATFFCHEVDSVIIPDGTRYMENNTFNSCSVKYVYLPDTLVELDKSFWGYFHKAEVIYYGGTKDEWDNLCKVDRGDIDVKEIVFEQNADDLK